jgi:phosphoribosyl 1,2-cyclic phosphodiesterase
MIRFAALASGSAGNALVADSGRTRVLLDCGLPPSETARRLARLGLEPGDLDAILLTHEHDDHAAHAFGFAAMHRIAVWLTHGTLRALEEAGAVRGGAPTRVIEGREAFALGDFEVFPIAVSHDAREPVQYVLSDGAYRLGVLTDVGVAGPHLAQALSGCDALVLECNHDTDLLRASPYPPWLKKRIAGPFGHLSNGEAEALLASLDRSRLRHVVCAHLSRTNNRPELARAALARALGCAENWVEVARQDEGFGWRELG